MDTGGWFLVDDLLDKANRHIYTRSRGRPTMDLRELATLASDGTEDLSKLQWELSVLIRRSSRPGVIFWQRIVRSLASGQSWDTRQRVFSRMIA